MVALSSFIMAREAQMTRNKFTRKNYILVTLKQGSSHGCFKASAMTREFQREAISIEISCIKIELNVELSDMFCLFFNFIGSITVLNDNCSAEWRENFDVNRSKLIKLSS